MTAPKFRIAVIGGGLGGLSCAIALARCTELEVQLYEAAHEFKEIGAGIGVFRRPYHVLQEMGLENVMRDIFPGKITEEDVLAFVLRKADQENGVEVREIVTKMGTLTLHRADLQQALAAHLEATGRAAVHLNKRLVSYEDLGSSNPIKLHFKDGTTAECDVLVGADGIHSTVRKQMYTEAAQRAESQKTKEELMGSMDPVWSGWLAYRAVIPAEELEAQSPGHRALNTAHNYMGKHKHLIVFPMAHHHSKLINIVAACSWPEKEGTIFEGPTVEDRPQQELTDLFVGWDQEVQDMLKLAKSPSRWVVNALKGLPMSAYKRVVLLGDSAHAMTPHQGSGAGQAIEDAYVLAALLTHPLATAETLPQALKCYEAVRLPKANEVMRLSRENGYIYDLADPRFLDLDTPNPDVGRLHELAETVENNWKWAWTTEAMEDRDSAVKTFEQKFEQTAPGQFQESDMKGSMKYRAGLGHGQQTAVSL